jgi:membrane protein DedA with SNARE-associated domain
LRPPPFLLLLAIAPFIQTYGYLAVFVGALLEGETVLILAGYSVSRGYLEFLPVVILAAAAGAIGDFTYFTLGRIYGPGMIRRYPSLRRVRARAILGVRRWGPFSAFVTRFVYGLRIVLPMTMGASKMRPATFVAFNVLGASAFAAFYVTLGFLFGEALAEMLGYLRPYERYIVVGVITAGAVFWAVRKWRLYRTSEEVTRRAAEELRRARREERRGVEDDA